MAMRSGITGATVAARAVSAAGKGWRYALGGKPNPAEIPAGASGVTSDCTGFAWWAAGRPGTGRLSTSPLWVSTPGPTLGGVVWHDARPPAMYGHAGVIIAVHPNGDFDTADCSSTSPDARGGAIRIVKNARAFWTAKGGGRMGFWRPSWIAEHGAAAATGAGAILLGAAAAWAWYKFGRKA